MYSTVILSHGIILKGNTQNLGYLGQNGQIWRITDWKPQKIAQRTPITKNPGSGQRQKLKCHPGEGMHKIKYWCSSVVTCKWEKRNKEIATPVNQNKSDPNLPYRKYPFPPIPQESQCPYPIKTQQKNGQRKDCQFSTQNIGPKRNYDRQGGGNENNPISIA